MIRSNSYVRAAAVALILAAGAAGVEAQSSEGIKVHGDWTIEVRQPDGTIITKREFKNALDVVGRGTLLTLLTIDADGKPTWGINLAPPEFGAGACVEGSCATLQPVPAGLYPTVPQNLTVTTANGAITLNGSVTASQTGTIGVVSTYLFFCSTTGCSSLEKFSGTNISPILVTPGQIVQVKVVISFS